MPEPLISICVPTYERVDFLQRLLESIKIQTFRDFEVIITDDSKTEAVSTYIKGYTNDFQLYYHKNTPALGTARNMVEGKKYARSQWMKIIHDDDFFASEHALQSYADAIASGAKIIFAGFNIYLEDTGVSTDNSISQKQFRKISRDPSLLFGHNLLGPPSVLMVHNSIKEVYDPSLRWFTDVEYYYRVLAKENGYYIDRPLVSISYNDSQITSYTRTNPKVVIPESLYLINKYGKGVASNIIAYDSWWRVFRNMDIKTVDDLKYFAPDESIPVFVKKMLMHQRLIPGKLIKMGLVSKMVMSLSFIFNSRRVKY